MMILNKRHGITLIELLAALALTGILFAALASSSLAFMQVSHEAEVLQRIQRELVFAMEAIENEMKLAVGLLGSADDWQIVLVDYDILNHQYITRTVSLSYDRESHTLQLGTRILSRNVGDFTVGFSSQPNMRHVRIASTSALPMIHTGNLPIVVAADVRLRNHGIDAVPFEPELVVELGSPSMDFRHDNNTWYYVRFRFFTSLVARGQVTCYLDGNTSSSTTSNETALGTEHVTNEIRLRYNRNYTWKIVAVSGSKEAVLEPAGFRHNRP